MLNSYSLRIRIRWEQFCRNVPRSCDLSGLRHAEYSQVRSTSLTRCQPGGFLEILAIRLPAMPPRYRRVVKMLWRRTGSSFSSE